MTVLPSRAPQREPCNCGTDRMCPQATLQRCSCCWRLRGDVAGGGAPGSAERQELPAPPPRAGCPILGAEWEQKASAIARNALRSKWPRRWTANSRHRRLARGRSRPAGRLRRRGRAGPNRRGDGPGYRREDVAAAGEAGNHVGENACFHGRTARACTAGTGAACISTGRSGECRTGAVRSWFRLAGCAAGELGLVQCTCCSRPCQCGWRSWRLSSFPAPEFGQWLVVELDRAARNIVLHYVCAQHGISCFGPALHNPLGPILGMLAGGIMVPRGGMMRGGGLRGLQAAKAGNALRPVGRYLESVDDVLANPWLLEGRSPPKSSPSSGRPQAGRPGPSPGVAVLDRYGRSENVTRRARTTLADSYSGARDHLDTSEACRTGRSQAVS